MSAAVEPAPAAYTVRYLAELLGRHRRALAYAHVVAVAATAASIPLPLLLPLLVDEVLLGQPAWLVPWVRSWAPADWHGPVLYVAVIFGIAVGLRLTGLGLGAVQVRAFMRVAKDLIWRLRCQLLGRLERAALSEYETMGSGSVATHLVVDLQTIDDFVAVTLGRLLVAALTILGTAAVLLWLHWGLALFILCMNPVVIYFTILLGKRMQELKKRENDAIGVFQDTLAETLDGIHQIRAHNRERHYIRRAVDGAREIRDRSADYAWQSDLAARASATVFLLGFDMFRAVSMLMVVFSGLSIGEMMAVFGYLWFMLAPVQELLGVQYAYYAAAAALERVNGLLGLREEPRHPHRVDPFREPGGVAVEVADVHFAFQPEQPVLRGVSLRVAPGERVAFVGASGAGKSTLMQVLLGLYPAARGTVRYNGAPVEEIGFDVVREHAVIVLQHPTLFNDTLAANLTLGRERPEAELWRALEIAQLRGMAAELPDGLGTRLGVDGVRLSGGQRQRLAIARLVLLEPRLLILDEATSMLDTHTEERLHRALFGHFAGCTALIVAHRLSAVRQADQVYVLEDGRLAEQGGHEALMDRDGLYAKLYARQAR